MFTNYKNAPGNEYSTLGRSGSVFRRVARGKYELPIRPVPQTAAIPIESQGAVTEPIGPMKDADDAWALEDDKSPPQVAPVPEQPKAKAAGYRCN